MTRSSGRGLLLRRVIAGLIALCPLFLMAAIVGLTDGGQLARTWTPVSLMQETSNTNASQSATGTIGAPSISGTANPAVIAAQRGVAQAAAQANFLVTATTELAKGTQAFANGAPDLVAKTTTAAQGAKQLAAGLIELQNGTAALGKGATKVADGVGTAVDKVASLPVIRDELLKALEEIDTELANVHDPQAGDVRLKLVAIRSQVTNFSLPPELLGQLGELKTGSREVADQLLKPGKDYHEGIYKAAKGGKELADGLAQAEGVVGDVRDNVNKLNDGAAAVKAMADKNDANIKAIQRALPRNGAESLGTGNNHNNRATTRHDEHSTTTNKPQSLPKGASNAEAMIHSSRTPVLSPTIALAAAMLVLLGAVSLGNARNLLGTGYSFATRSSATQSPPATRKERFLHACHMALPIIGVLVLIVAIAAGFIVVTSAPVGGLVALMGIVILLLSAGSFYAGTRATAAVIGPRAALVVTGVAAVIQLVVVGLAWRMAATAPLEDVARIGVQLFPLHYPTVALTALGNNGSHTQLGLAVGGLVALIVASVIACWVQRSRKSAVSSEETPCTAASKEDTAVLPTVPDTTGA